MYTKWQEGRGRTREEQKRKERWKKKVEERWLIRSRKCLNCKWVNVSRTDMWWSFHPSLCRVAAPRKTQSARYTLSFYVQFPRDRRARDKWNSYLHAIRRKSRGKHPRPQNLSLFLCLSITHTNTRARRPTFFCLWASSLQPCRQIRFDTCDSTVNPG